MRISLRLALLVLVALVLGSVYSFRNSSSAQRIKPSVESVSCTAAPPGMVSWWPGEGNANDIRGENSGTLQGTVTFPAGEVEHAFGFAGNGDVDVPDSRSLDPATGTITVDAWVNPALVQPGASIVNKRTVSNNTGYTLEQRFTGDGTILWNVIVGGNSVAVVSNSALPLNAWTHVAGTYDGTTSTLYFNGTPVGSTASSGTMDPSPNAALEIGRNLVTNAHFTGQIDEVEVFSRALSLSEIQDIAFAGTAGKCRPRCVTPIDSMVGWWTGDDNPYDIWNQNHGTFESGPSPTPSPSASPYLDGKVGRAFNFDGSGSYVDLDNYSALNLTDAITIDAWVRPTTPLTGPASLTRKGSAGPIVSNSGFEAILTKWQSSQSQANSAKPEQSGDSYGLWLTSQVPQPVKAAGATPSAVQTNLALYGEIETTCGTYPIFGGTVPLNVWTHVAMTYDSNTGVLALYVNGVQVAADPFEGCSINQAATTQVNIGCQTCGMTPQPVDPFQGQIDEVEVFGSALDQSQVQDINNGASAGKCKPCYSPPLGMVGWWNGDANSNDSSSSGNNGTWDASPAYAFGKVGQAFSFNGTNAAVVAAPSSVSVMNHVPLTVDAWVRPALRTDGRIADFFPNNAVSNDTPGSHGHGFGVNVLSDGSEMTIEYQDGFRVITSASFNPDQWYHIAVVYTNGNVKSYVDGLRVDDFNYEQGEFDSTSPVSIGKHNDDVETYGTRRFFKGLIDEVEIFNRELSLAEIQSIVAAGASGKCKSANQFVDKAQKSGAGTATTSPVHPNSNQTDQVGDATVTMVDVTSPGSTDYQTLSTYQQGPLPFGYGDPLEIADISTSKTFNGDATICFTLLSISDSEEQSFNHLRILHLEGNVLVDRTSSHYFPLRYLCASVPAAVGFSPFVISQNQNLAPSAANGNIGGTITDSRGAPLGGVTINLSGTQSREAITDGSGKYSFDSVETNGFYTVTPARVNYTFTPANRSFSLLGVHTEASFTATANGNGDHPNAIDTTEFFVRQQYLDFLGREPDAPGFAGWVSTINNCAAGDATCDRVHVSEMFYRSQEFQERGYFAYRFYATAFGRKPEYAEFMPDLQRVSGFLTSDQLEAAKTAFVDDFMLRPAFGTQYNSLGNAAYVDALMNTAGVSLANRQTLIDSLNSRTATRAQVLRQIAESGEVYAKYYNQAFVVMEYFGYLHRDPDALYTNWISVLDANPADSRHMVEGFVNSTEYRNRFDR